MARLEISTQSIRLVVLFISLCMPLAAFGAPTAPIVYVSGNGTGDFNCDGTDDQVEINQALTYIVNNPTFTTVYLKGPRTYVISASVKIGSNTILTGDSTAVIKLKDQAGWSTDVPLVTMIATGNHDIKVHGFEIDGNDVNNYVAGTTPANQRGKNRYNILYFRSVTRLEVYNMYLHDNMNDALLVKSCSYVDYHDNRIIRDGHDGLYAYSSSYVTAYRNTITCRTNSGIRFADSNHCKAYLNDITQASGGGSGFEIQRSNAGTIMNDVEIYNNRVYGTANQGLWLFGNANTVYTRDKACNVYIHNNLFYNCDGGIQVSGFYDTRIENNVIDACGAYGIATATGGFPPPTGGTGYNTTIRNNIISNNTYGYKNTLSSTHSFDSSFNCFYNNTSGNFSGAAITTANELLNVDPLFANRTGRDYHLKSRAGRWDGSQWVRDAVKSPCIDAGYPQSAFSLEPQPNGGRINIGAYGNTAEASKSGDSNALRDPAAWLSAE